MGTKANPGRFDCLAAAAPDEPCFTLLARDLSSDVLVDLWADAREEAIAQGRKPESDRDKITEARQIAEAMREWRRTNRP